MKHDQSFDSLQERLSVLIEEGAFGASEEAQARMLLARQQRPIRVALLGPSTAGRRRAIDAIAGGEVAPPDTGCPAVEVKFGKAPAIVATRASGARITMREAELSALPGDAMLLSVTRNSPRLKRIEFLNVVTDESPQDIAAALTWAAKSADIFIWWSDGFSKGERSVWLEAPAKVKDHAFLVLSGEDACDRAEKVQAARSGGFLDVIPLTPQEARGGLASARLTDGLERHLKLGREADEAAIQLLLRRVETKMGGRLLGAAGVETSPAASIKPWWVEAPAANNVAPLRARPEPVRVEIEAPADAREASPLARSCIAHLRERARDLRCRLEADPAAVDAVEFCLDTVRALVELADEHSEQTGEAADGILETLISAEDLLLLLSAERDGTAREDAVCVLLQLRTDLEAGPHGWAVPEAASEPGLLAAL